MTRYIVIITCRNGADTIEQAIYSWIEQTIKPIKIIIVNDGSMDDSYKKIMLIKSSHPDLIELIEKPFTPYDIKRIALNWNDALALANKLTDKQFDYHVIATEDSIYEPRYMEKILEVMQVNNNLFACSGEYDNDRNSNIHSPHGIGRVIRQSVFNKLELDWNNEYPYQCGFESAILYDAMRLGYTNSVMPYAEIRHLRELGSIHKFIEWPQSDKILGFSFLYSSFRFFNMAFHKQISYYKAVYLSMIYLFFKPSEVGYFRKYNKQLRQFIKQYEHKRIRQLLYLE